VQKVPQRISLVAETERVLLEGIAQGRWQGSLPGERPLYRELQVSRWTLRAALRALHEKGYVRSRRGRPCEISGRARRRSDPERAARVGVIMPEPLFRQTPFASVWLNDLRGIAQKAGIEFDFYDLPRLYTANPATHLQEFVSRNPHDCWILFLSTPALQRWFGERDIPAIVAGSLHAEVRLPSQDNHFRAAGRHAVGAMIGLGHRRIAVLALQHDRKALPPGIGELERGAREAAAALRQGGCDLSFHRHSSQPEEICRMLDRVLDLPARPTALLVAHSATFLTVLSHFAQRGVVMPRDLSVVVIQDEAYFRHIVPELSHYEWNPEAFSHRMMRMVKRALEHTLSPDTAVRIVPRFVPGKTLRPPSGAL
jgi:DNA-binding LacI/PurR family transcriptional regulator